MSLWSRVKNVFKSSTPPDLPTPPVDGPAAVTSNNISDVLNDDGTVKHV